MTDLQINNSSISAYSLNGEGGARGVDIHEQGIWPATEGTTWVHLNYNDPEDIRWLSEQSSLEPLVVEALQAEETRPRTTVIGDGILVALRGVNLTPGADPDDMVSIRLWIDRNCIVSTRKRDLLSVADLLEQLESGRGPKGPADFIVGLVDRLVWRMSDTVDQFEDRVADLETRILETGDSELKYELAGLRRQTITLRRYLAPQREALTHLISEKVSWLNEDNRLRLREVNDRLIRHIEDLDAVRERAAVAQEELLNRLSEQLNSRMYVLSIVAAVFLPLGFLTGLLGINVGGIPGAENPLAFWEFVAIITVVIALQLWLFRRKKWL